jgi:outer membrane protein OmpA-like peptidoglycan-associated protein
VSNLAPPAPPAPIIPPATAPTTKPPAVYLGFADGKNLLSTNARTYLSSLAGKLKAGSSVTITGYAKDNAPLAKSRARAVENYLLSQIAVRITLKFVTTSAANKVLVVTTRL